jgi:hypothetical protein
MMYSLIRPVHFAAVAFAALTLTSCATPLHVNSFIERGIDFAQYRSYNWAPTRGSTTGDPRLDSNPFFEERVQADVDKQLALKGLEKTATGIPALVLHYHASVTQKLDLNGADQAYNSCSDCTPYLYDAGTLVLDFVDARTNTLVWRGWSEGNFDGVIDDQTWMEEQIDRAVTRILERLPGRVSSRH